VVEIDRDLIARLRQRFPPERLTIHEGDALEFDFGSLKGEGRLKIVGNLPYNISSPLLFHLVRSPRWCDMHFMLQKEVVDRMVAAPGSKDFGRLSVMLQYRYHMERLFIVPPGAFNPPPKVDSAIVRMIPRRLPESRRWRYGERSGAVRQRRDRGVLAAAQDAAQHPARIHRRGRPRRAGHHATRRAPRTSPWRITCASPTRWPTVTATEPQSAGRSASPSSAAARPA
jgi:16S rRNA A1518/A1519 N6-dimethyltransferase RsmA/KsgA/DIM1 with predicted DNA glycosylase/AP lyase activity